MGSIKIELSDFASAPAPETPEGRHPTVAFRSGHAPGEWIAGMNADALLFSRLEREKAEEKMGHAMFSMSLFFFLALPCRRE